MLENLSRNAAQALMAKGATDGRPKAIRFAAIRTDGLALIEISDTGPGFPPDQDDRIFEPFHKSTSDVGAGLGLAIAARPRDAQRRRDRARAREGGRFLLRRAVPDQAADRRGLARKAARVLPDAERCFRSSLARGSTPSPRSTSKRRRALG